MKAAAPTLVSFAVTRECNLKCKHCYSQSVDSPHPRELNTDEAKQLISQIAETGAHLLIMDGGEPLMRPDIFDLVRQSRREGLTTVMGTNGTLITAGVADKLVDAGIQGLAISLDGAEAEAHDGFRGVEGAWEQTLQGIENVRQAGIPFQIAPTLRHGDWKQWGAIADKAKAWGANAVEVFDYIPAGRGEENPEFEMTVEERQAFVGEYVARQRADDEMVYRCVALPQIWVEIEKTVPEDEVLAKFVRSCCAAGTRYCCIVYDGTVYPCMLLQEKAGDVREQSFVDIWQTSEVFQILRDRDRLEGKCGRCDYRYVCGGARCRIYAKTGSLTAEDDACWFSDEELKR
jgi:radical SAM protein with 4Fe4S-binding SPASM domain